MDYKDYIKWERMPTTWCPGCAIGTIFKQTAFALAEPGPARGGADRRLGHRLQRPGGRIFQRRQRPRHPWPGDPRGRGDQEGQSPPQGDRLQRRRRPRRDRRQPSPPRQPPGRRPGRHLRQQRDLRDDRRPDGADDAGRGEDADLAPRERLRSAQHPGHRHEQPAPLVRPRLDVPRRPSPAGHPGGRGEAGIRLRRSHGLLHRELRPPARLQVRPRDAHHAEKGLQAQAREPSGLLGDDELGVVKHDG